MKALIQGVQLSLLNDCTSVEQHWDVWASSTGATLSCVFSFSLMWQKPKSPSSKWVLNQSKLEVNQPRVDWMEMNGHAKCDLNHFGYGLQALEVHRKSLPFINASSFSLVSPSIWWKSQLLSLSDLFYVVRRTAPIKDDGHDFHFSYSRLTTEIKQKKKNQPS